MGGRLIGRSLGLKYQEYLKNIRNSVAGSPDFCAYFFLRAFQLTTQKGYFGLLATKSIAETGSRVVCLDQIIRNGGAIYRAYSRFPWPGNASVVVSIIWIARDGWKGVVTLDDEPVPLINGALEVDLELPRPQKLKALKGLFSQGQDIMGRGFELTSEERNEILSEDPRCQEVIFPLFTGQDFNTMPELEPYRWVIYFRDWPEEQARRYGAAFRRVENLVKPYREALTGQIHQDCYWKLWDLRPSLMREVETHETLLASAIVTKYVSFRQVPAKNVYRNKLKLYFLYRWADFSILQSSLHTEWAQWTCATLGASTITYSTSDALETWPMPRLTKDQALEGIGEKYHRTRESIFVSLRIGLTKFYNRFHDPADRSAMIEEMRNLHRQMDLEVAKAYEWEDLDLGHGFQVIPHLPDTDNIRFTISASARTAVIGRLAELNRIRYQEEVEKGLHGGETTKRLSRQKSIRDTSSEQVNLTFDMPVERAADSVAAARTFILDHLRSRPSWHAKADILASTGIAESIWNATINDLTLRGEVERQGERRGAKYRAVSAGGDND